MKRMRSAATAALLFGPLFLALLSTPTLNAQQTPYPMGTQAPPNVIDGSKTPELIPDSVAYRLWLVAVAEDPADAPSPRQQSHLRAAGLGDSDLLAASKILANFKTRYAQLIAEYNAAATANPNSNDGLSGFLSDRGILVQNTRDELKAALTPKGMTSLDAHVQSEKTRMKVAKEDQ